MTSVCYVMALVLIFVTGAVIGSFFDGFHTHSATTFYHRPVLLQMAWWTLPLFGLAALGISTTHVRMDRVLGRPARPLSPVVTAFGIAYFGGFYFASAFLPVSSPGKLLLLLLGWVALWLLLDRTWQGVLLAVLTAIAGCAVEMTLVQLGAFGYRHPDLGGVPYWLPALYLIASLTVGNLGRQVLTQ